MLGCCRHRSIGSFCRVFAARLLQRFGEGWPCAPGAFSSSPPRVVAHEKPPSLAGFDGLRSSRLAPPPLPFVMPFVMPGHSAGLLCCAFAGAYPVGSNDLKPSKPASGSVFSCARRRSRASEGDFPRVRCRFEQTKRGSRAADGVDGERRQQARSEIPRPRGARRARRGRRLAITRSLLRPFRGARRAPAAGPKPRATRNLKGETWRTGFLVRLVQVGVGLGIGVQAEELALPIAIERHLGPFEGADSPL